MNDTQKAAMLNQLSKQFPEADLGYTMQLTNAIQAVSKQYVEAERNRWVAAVEEMESNMHPSKRPESMPDDAVAGYYQALEELLTRMEVAQ